MVACACACVASLVCVPVAQGASYTLRPNSDPYVSGWQITPAGPDHFAVLDDAVLQPAAPSTGGDYLHESSNGPIHDDIGFDTAVLTAPSAS